MKTRRLESLEVGDEFLSYLPREWHPALETLRVRVFDLTPWVRCNEAVTKSYPIPGTDRRYYSTSVRPAKEGEVGTGVLTQVIHPKTGKALYFKVVALSHLKQPWNGSLIPEGVTYDHAEA